MAGSARNGAMQFINKLAAWGKAVTSSISGSHLMYPLPFFSPLSPQSHLEKIIEKPNQPATRAIKSADSFEEKVSAPEA